MKLPYTGPSKPKKREINKIIIHCSDSPDDMRFDIADVNKWHKARNFPPDSNGSFVGYHWLVLRDGTCQMGRPDNEAGCHCKGHNHDSIGICLMGTGKNYTPEQWRSLDYLLMNYMSAYGLEPKQVFGHCEFDTAKAQGKTCPNIPNMEKFRDELEIRYYNQGEKDDIRRT